MLFWCLYDHVPVRIIKGLKCNCCLAVAQNSQSLIRSEPRVLSENIWVRLRARYAIVLAGRNGERGEFDFA